MSNVPNNRTETNPAISLRLQSVAKIENMPIDSLKRHFRQLMKPSNMILIPTALKGLGDLPSFLSIIKRGV